MASLLNEIRDEYLLYTQNHVEYELKVNSISDMFALIRKNRLKGDYCAVYLVGRYQSADIFMFGVNPGLSTKNSPIEDKQASKSWEDYQGLYLNFFQYMSDNKFESPYYTALWYLLSGLTGSNIPKERKWELFDQYLCNIELIPYHSEGMALPAKLNKEQFEYLENRFKSSTSFIRQYNPKLLIFNGRIWETLLINHNLIEQYTKVRIKDQFNLYFFELDGMPGVLFDRFFQRHFWAITNHDRVFTIPKLIHDKFHNLYPNSSLHYTVNQDSTLID